MKKKCLLFVLVFGMLFSFQVVSAEVDYTNEADMLNALGLFNGTQNGYELNRVPTRVEAAAMLVRLLGGVNEANEMKYEHPFTDVPEWADNIVGYMYEKGYTSGIGNNLFGSNQVTIARDYATFMLRSLGYSSSSDFNYLEALNFAESKGIITNEEAEIINSQDFKRNEMVLLSYKTLRSPLKDSGDLLADKLYENGTIDKSKAFEQGMTDSFETVISNIDSSVDKLEVNSSVIYINADKKEIDNGDEIGFDMEKKEYFVDGYAGSICFKKGINIWEGLNVKYQISFYNEGKFVKQIEYLTHNYNGKNDLWTDFITPSDEFDEIKIAAYSINNEEISKDLEGIFEIITTKDITYLKDTILKYGNVHATSNGDSRYDYNSADVMNVKAWQSIYNGDSIYNDGSVYRARAHKYIVDGNFTIEFTDEGSFIDANKIIGLPRNNFNGQINLILICDEGNRLVKVFVVK